METRISFLKYIKAKKSLERRDEMKKEGGKIKNIKGRR